MSAAPPVKRAKLNRDTLPLSLELRLALTAKLSRMSPALVKHIKISLEQKAFKLTLDKTTEAIIRIAASNFNAPWANEQFVEKMSSRLSFEDSIIKHGDVIIDEYYQRIPDQQIKMQVMDMIPMMNRDMLEQYCVATGCYDLQEAFYLDAPSGVFDTLPKGIWCDILNMLSLSEIFSVCSRVSWNFFKMTMSYPIWSSIYTFRFGSRLLQNEHIPALMQKLPNIKALKFGKYVRYDKMEEIVSHLAERRNIVESLNFAAAPVCVGDKLFEDLFASLLPWKIQDINLSSCRTVSDTTLKLISQSCPDLRNLNLKFCRISDTGLFYLSEGCHKLELLTLRYCVHVTDAGLANLSQGCKRLSVVSFRNCGEMTDEGIRFLSKSKCLTRVSFSKCFRLTNDSLQYLADSCSNLEYAHFAFCNLITDEGVICLARKCKSLRNVDFSMCKRITDTAVHALAESCSNLEHLCLKGCPLIQSSCSEYAFSRCPRLSKLCLPSLVGDTAEDAEDIDD
jgi:hypothetical protein